MKKRKSIILIILLTIIGLLIYPKVKRFIEIDICLDKGGSWNYNKSECEYSEKELIEQDLSKPEIFKSEILSLRHLENTKWKNLVAENCVDTLTFNTNRKGNYYSCEMNYTEKITYTFKENKLEIERYTLRSEVDTSQGLYISSKYFMELINETLKMNDIKHLYRNKFESVSKEFLNQEFIKVKN